MSSESNLIRIVIIGAGVSGLTCARQLSKCLRKKPHSINILEGRDRIGGRTLSVSELNIDLGASWVFHDHSAVRSLARELNINTMEQYENGDSLIDTGHGVQRRSIPGIHAGMSRLRGGTGSLCRAMFNELTTQHRDTVSIRLQTPVKSLVYNTDKTITVHLHDESTLSADYVVLALPPKLAVTKIQMTPALSPSVTNKLRECVTWMASTCKAVLVYERAWWKDLRLSGFAVSRRSRVQEWHDASSETCNALFVFCLAGVKKQEVIDGTVQVFGEAARNPIAVHIVDWSHEEFTSVDETDGRGGHPHASSSCRDGQWNHSLWFGNSEVSDTDGGFIEGAVLRGTEVAEKIAAIVSH